MNYSLPQQQPTTTTQRGDTVLLNNVGTSPQTYIVSGWFWHHQKVGVIGEMNTGHEIPVSF